MSDSKTNVSDFIGELNAGILIEQLGMVLSEVALGTTVNGNKSKKGSVDVKFTITPMNEGQVIITTTLSKLVHTKNGQKTEKTSSDTPMFVGKGGALTINPPKVDESGQFNLQHQNENKIKSIK